MQKWLEKRYDLLEKAFGTNGFKHEDAAKVLTEGAGDRADQINVILSGLKKNGRISVEQDKSDARKKIYRLKSRQELISESLSLGKGKITRGDLETILKKAADLIRTRVDYKFILVLLFLKRVSDKWENEYRKALEEAIKDGLSEKDAKAEAKNAAYHDFDIPEEFLWENLRKEVESLPARFSKALNEIAKRNEGLKDVVNNVDFIQFASSSENAELLRQLVELFSERKLSDVSPDVIGEAYEWTIRYFAPQKAKEGEIYTPREVIRLLVEILDPQPEESVYDPACGSGGMLIEAYYHLKKVKGEAAANKLFLYGQEASYQILALCKMNTYIHDIHGVQLQLGDTLLYPKFYANRVGGSASGTGGKVHSGLKSFDVVLANPPWNQDGYDEGRMKNAEFLKDRFPFGLATKQSADWLWIQHMLASANEKKGRIGVVIDTGALFRGGKEAAIRSQVVESDKIECVILLPEKLFYNTSAPGAIIIFRHTKPKERRGKILFINASSEFEQHPDVRKLNRLGDRNVKRIVDAYNKFSESEGFSRIVPHEKIKASDYNLNVTLYVSPKADEEQIDIAKEWNDLKQTEAELKNIDGRIEGYLKELHVFEEQKATTVAEPEIAYGELERIKAVLKKHKPELEKKWKVNYLGVFGSYVRSEQTERSDLDILVEFSECPGLFEFMDIQDYLSEATGIKVDLVTKSGLKPFIKDYILEEVIEI